MRWHCPQRSAQLSTPQWGESKSITVDGAIDASGRWFVLGDDTADLADATAVLQQQSAASDALLLGRTTFEEMRAFWPNQTNDTTGIAADLNQVQNFVVSPP